MQLPSVLECRAALTAACVFIAWTLTSFLCHQCAKIFLTISSQMFASRKVSHAPFYNFYVAVIITSVQCISCLLLIRTDKNVWQSRGMAVLIATHVLATLATNYSMVFIEAASTLAIKLLEPVTMTIAHYLVFQKMVPLQTIVSVPLIVYGAFRFTESSNVAYSTAGIVLAIASNIILAVRNITIKMVQNESATNSSLVLNSWSHVALNVLLQGVVVAGLHVFDLHRPHHVFSSMLVGSALASGNFHVAYSYISTSIVLRVMNVVSHSIANIFKRLLVVLLLSALGTRQLSASNYLGLAIAVAGLLIHTHGKVVADNVRREGHKRSTFISLLFLALLASAVVSLSSITWAAGRPPAAGQLLDTAFSSENNGLRNDRDAITEESHLIEAESDPEMREFLSWRLVDHPEETDKRCKTLTTSKQIIQEAQRILVNLLQDLIGAARHVMLIDVPVFENKGDPAIAAGEIMLMKRLGKTIVYYCETYSCQNDTRLRKAVHVSRRYHRDDLVILMQGGGNIVGYPLNDRIRTKFLNTFHNRKSIILTQSIWLHGNYSANLDFARNIYSNRPNLTILIRDRQSLEIAKHNFKGVNLILAPDMAFCMGMTPRQMPPLYDIVWLRRNDSERIHYTVPKMPASISVELSDWYSWKSNKGRTDIETAFNVASEGFQFLQRGRVVVTDRLHGHILCLLMDIPHVIIDNPPYHKLSSFYRTWTQGLDNTILIINGSLALESGLELLERYQKWLPSLGVSYKPVGG